MRNLHKLILSLCLVLSATLINAESLPKGLKWQTNNKEPIFTDYHPKKGGQFRSYILSFPQTFRLYGPNSNSGGFVSYNRRWAFLSLTHRHPNTNEIIPQLATHWSIKDAKTIYYKLDADARWSDDKPITADDYLFAFEFLQSPHIQAPFYNQYMRDHFESIDKIDAHTIKITLKKPSWKILDEANISPIPKHATKLDSHWVKKNQWVANVVPGPYVISDFKKGRYIIFKRNKNWWGYNKRYFKDLYHFDKIRLDVIQTMETAYEKFKKGSLSIFAPSALFWVNKTNIKATKNGYILKQRIHTKTIQGPSGLFFNNQDEIWKNKDLRRAFAYTIDFANLNKNFLYGFYQRKTNFFDVFPPYYKDNFSTYPFDLDKANQLLNDANWVRNPKTGIREKNKQQLILDIVTGNDEALRYLPFIKEISAKAGILVQIKKYDGAQFFDLINNRKFDTVLLSFGGGIFPSPRQFLHTENLKKGSNNIFMYANSEIDKLIELYEFNLTEKKRIDAIFKIEDRLKEDAIYVPFWKEAAQRFMWWRYIKGPPPMTYKTGINIDLLWFDEQEKKTLDVAMDAEKPLPKVTLEADPYKLKNN
ncbi:MAG: ABC transporter substrate-binding protein [SAR324 cluster bacterium]|nr:ABC transporter substrate-binding protein [SAR324 cluster bacterium]